MLRNETKEYIQFKNGFKSKKNSIKRIRTKFKTDRRTPFIFSKTTWISRKWERKREARRKKKIKLPCSLKWHARCLIRKFSSWWIQRNDRRPCLVIVINLMRCLFVVDSSHTLAYAVHAPALTQYYEASICTHKNKLP